MSQQSNQQVESQESLAVGHGSYVGGGGDGESQSSMQCEASSQSQSVAFDSQQTFADILSNTLHLFTPNLNRTTSRYGRTLKKPVTRHKQPTSRDTHFFSPPQQIAVQEISGSSSADVVLSVDQEVTNDPSFEPRVKRSRTEDFTFDSQKSMEVSSTALKVLSSVSAESLLTKRLSFICDSTCPTPSIPAAEAEIKPVDKSEQFSPSHPFLTLIKSWLQRLHPTQWEDHYKWFIQELGLQQQQQQQYSNNKLNKASCILSLKDISLCVKAWNTSQSEHQLLLIAERLTAEEEGKYHLLEGISTLSKSYLLQHPVHYLVFYQSTSGSGLITLHHGPVLQQFPGNSLLMDGKTLSNRDVRSLMRRVY